jgi:hypothetical protein
MTKLFRKCMYPVLGGVLAIAPDVYAQDGKVAFRPVTPCRVCDTRVGFSDAGGCPKGALNGGSAKDVTIAGLCAIPPDATGVSLNLTVIPTGGGLGDLRIAPNPPGALPLASIINYQNTEVVANAADVPIGTGVRIFADGQATDFVVDVQGYFASVVAEACWNVSPFEDIIRCTLPAPLSGPPLSATAMIDAHCSWRTSSYQILGAGLLRQSIVSAGSIQLTFVGSHNTAFAGNKVCAFSAELNVPSLDGPFNVECPGGEGIAKFTGTGTLVATACSTTAPPEPEAITNGRGLLDR